MRVNATIKVAFFIDSHCFECMTHKMVSRYGGRLQEHIKISAIFFLLVIQ